MQSECYQRPSKFNGTSTPKGSYRAKTGDNDCNVNSSRYSLSKKCRFRPDEEEYQILVNTNLFHPSKLCANFRSVTVLLDL